MLVNQPAILSGAFAAEGDKNVIPANNDGLSGLASIAKGFPPITQVPLAQGGQPPQRQDFNGIFNLFSQFLLYAQNGGVYAYNNTLDYQPPCIISYDGEFYSCVAENGPSTSAGVQPVTNTTYWEKLVPDVAVMQGATSSAAGSSGLVPAPAAGNQNKALFGDATYKQVVQKVNGVAADSGGNVNVDMSGYLPLTGGTLTGALSIQKNDDYGQINLKTTNNRERRLDISDTYLRLAVMTDEDKGVGGRYLVIDANSSLAYAFYVQEQISGDWSTYYLFGQHNIASQAQAEAGTNNTSPMTPVRVAQAINALALPKGTILPFAGGTIPSGFLACNGAAVSRTTYAALFSAIGTTYGSGDGSTTFNLPAVEDNRFLEFSSTRGTKKNAGLPNIQGQATFRVGDAGSYVSILRSGNGAFTAERDGATQIFNTNSVDADVFSVLAIDASRSSSIYGASTTVQPKSLTVRAIIKY